MTEAIFDTKIDDYGTKSTLFESYVLFDWWHLNGKFNNPNFLGFNPYELMTSVSMFLKYEPVDCKIRKFVRPSGLNDNKAHCLRPSVVMASYWRLQNIVHIDTSKIFSENFQRYRNVEKIAHTQPLKTNGYLSSSLKRYLPEYLRSCYGSWKKKQCLTHVQIEEEIYWKKNDITKIKKLKGR